MNMLKKSLKISNGMNKLILPLIIFSFLFGTTVFAQDNELPVVSEIELPVVSEIELPVVSEIELPNPGLTPDSPFYFLETIAEEIVTFFTFGDLKKAERYYTLAAERLAEVQAVVEKEKPELMEKTLERYRKQLQNSMIRAKKAQDKGKDIEKVMDRVGKATSKHLEVLAEVYEKVPEQAKSAIENAMKASIKGHERAVEVLKTKNVLGEVPEAVSLPANVPKKVKERIQMGVQQELEIEKALQGIEAPESPRDFCTESGGPTEICEKFPTKAFKSFKQIEAFCIESGGPPEVCSTVEDRCREYGVTTPGKCYLLLMTATVRRVPASEEKMEELRLRQEAQRAQQNQMEAEHAASAAKAKAANEEFEKTMIEYKNQGGGQIHLPTDS